MMTRERGGIVFGLLLVLFLAALVGLVYFVRHPLLRAAGGFWVVDDPLQPSDAILLLSDDNFYADRAAHAAELYRGRWAPRIVASGRMLRRYASIADLMQRDLIERGVPASAILAFPQRCDNTREEAEALRSMVMEHRWGRVLIVTSNSHTRRARYIFRRILPETVEVRVSSARDTDYDPDHWWETRRGVKRFLYESAAFPVAIWELRNIVAPGATPAPDARPAPVNP